MANNSKIAIAFIAGAALGASLGILFAPDKGTTTRTKIKDGFDDQKQGLKNKFDSLKSSVKSKFHHSKEKLESAFDDLAENVNEKTPDIIASLENKLAELKKAADSLKK